MGRKPNPIISRLFTRGAKLEGTSNRYHWTCKNCGERFPKGRIESLYNHLTRKCPVLSLREKVDLSTQIRIYNRDQAPATPSTAKRLKAGNREVDDEMYQPPDQQPLSRRNV